MFAWLLLAASPPQASCASADAASDDQVLLKDDFDDGSLTTNTKGIGGPWKARPVLTATGGEADGAFNVSIGSEHANYMLRSAAPWKVDFWNDEGITVEFVIRETTVRSAHKRGETHAFSWQFGFISANRSQEKPFWGHGWRFPEGGIWFVVQFADGLGEARFNVYLCNKTLPEGADEIWRGDRGWAIVNHLKVAVKFPVTVRAHLNRHGFRFELPGQPLPKHQDRYEWGTREARFGTPTPITDEFENGAWLAIHPRMNGLGTGGKNITPNYNGPNSGSLESVSIVRPAKR
jgi:hypothetical protein